MICKSQKADTTKAIKHIYSVTYWDPQEKLKSHFSPNRPHRSFYDDYTWLIHLSAVSRISPIQFQQDEQEYCDYSSDCFSCGEIKFSPTIRKANRVLSFFLSVDGYSRLSDFGHSLDILKTFLECYYKPRYKLNLLLFQIKKI